MKKLFVTLCFAVATICAVNAQTNDMTLGARLGGNLEVSFQLPVGANRVEIDGGIGLGYYDHFSLQVAASYQWLWNIAGITGFDWYVGPGAYVGIYNFDNIGVTAGVLGQIGLEYNFNFPLQLSLDWRPMINVLGFGDGHWGYWNGVALGVRYRF
ncbi:hypothetical protein LJC25_03010 [Bacteroidales bacterium OttesenSCG-928-K03]|nr:hypothetical protein [Odoribacter sp. OttesenSCG-928-L07]MDL2239536.1 hypothetical protein [Bacteroidales bacterium OttesenSCG-928-L14]MDL2242679.1 hypothetical protein [Bacteroidales bacterium OttesenSCG-928-K03]